ncbi:MAG: GIY-YIG nuclease family protein [bacterium]|nr:GIY-YIG nuclease family protein [bacterium]
MYYVYLLKSIKDGTYYTGMTEQLVTNRLKEHNANSNKYSSEHAPFKLIWHCAFQNKQKALLFEKYLKSGSGIALRNKRLI